MKSECLQTRTSLTRELADLGVRRGQTLLVHTSLSALGWVCGGAPTVVQALLDAVGKEGTLVVPAQNTENSDPAGWSNPPVPQEWWAVIREHMPAFDPRTTPSLGVGVIPETLRVWPGAVRSSHPQTSFAALGANAAHLMAQHALESRLGEESPLARLEAAEAHTLLLGAGFDACTAFHLAEYRVPHAPRTEYGCAVQGADGHRTWVSFYDIATDEDNFEELGKSFTATGAAISGQVGEATAHLFPIVAAVEFAVQWLTSCQRQG